MARRPKRIYYGPPGHETSLSWRVKVSDAKRSVVISGAVLHALKAYCGVTIGCALSNVAHDPKNRSAFPHNCYLAQFTKSTALIADKRHNKRKGGAPYHAVLYAHSYKHLTDFNDTGKLKQLVEKYPDLMEREFTLRPPRKLRPGSRGKRTVTGKGKGRYIATHTGALARAVKAGLIGPQVAEQLTQIADSL
jgi:hypothetical protein